MAKAQDVFNNQKNGWILSDPKLQVIKINRNALLPTPMDMGYILYSDENIFVNEDQNSQTVNWIPTGIAIIPPKGYFASVFLNISFTDVELHNRRQHFLVPSHLEVMVPLIGRYNISKGDPIGILVLTEYNVFPLQVIDMDLTVTTTKENGFSIATSSTTTVSNVDLTTSNEFFEGQLISLVIVSFPLMCLICIVVVGMWMHEQWNLKNQKTVTSAIKNDV